MNSRLLLVLVGTLALLPLHTFAQGEIVPLRPVLDLPEQDEARRVLTAHADTFMVQGRGDRLAVTYTSPTPLDLDIAPLQNKKTLDPEDLSHVTLPAGTNITAVIDLTVSAGWSPWNDKYYIGLYADKSILHQVSTLPTRFSSALTAIAHGITLREPYQASAPHALRGTRVLGISFSTIATVLLIISLIAIYLLSKPDTRQARMVASCIIATLLFGAWFDLDLLRWTWQQESDWYSKGTLEVTGSAVQVGKLLREHTPPDTDVLICTKSTDYFTKMVRYYAYPRQVSLKPENVRNAKVIVVNKSPGWLYQKGTLRCGSIEGPATEVIRFADGTAVFTPGHS